MCERDAKLQSCGCIPSVINYNLFVRERVRKKEITKYDLIKTKNLRKEGRITTWSKQGREWERKQERSRSKWREKERKKERNNRTKERNGLKLEEALSLFSHYSYVQALLLLYHITSHSICIHIYLSQIKLYAIAYEL